MHSSRMRTARLLTVSRSIRRGGRACLGGGAHVPGGIPVGVYMPGGVHALGRECMWTEFLAHACENVTFPQQ